MKKSIFVALTAVFTAFAIVAGFVPLVSAAEHPAPDAPTVYLARAAADSLALGIVEPSADSGSPRVATYYVEFVNPSGKPMVVDRTGKTTMVDIGDLSSDTKYTFRIYSINEVGVQSDRYVQITAQTSDQSGKTAPPSVSITPGDGTVLLTMDHFVSDETRFAEYIIDIGNAPGRVDRTEKSRRNTYVVSGLTNGVTYTLSVRIRTTELSGANLSDATVVYAVPGAGAGSAQGKPGITAVQGAPSAQGTAPQGAVPGTAHTVLKKPGNYIDGSAIFTITGDIKKLEDVLISGAPVAKAHYSSRTDVDNVVVTIWREGLAQLARGTHTVRFLFADGEAATTLVVGATTAANAAGSFAASGTHTVTASSLNVRAGASAASAVITRLPRGAAVTVGEVRDGFGKVTLADGTAGWVSVAYLSAQGASVPSASEGTARSTTANVHMRSGGGTKHASLGMIPRGAQVEWLRTDGKWAYISYQGTRGYVYAAYLIAG